MMERFHAMSDKVQFRAAVVADIGTALQEEKGEIRRVFLHLSRLYGLLSYRMPYAGKGTVRAFLMLCTMVDRERDSPDR